MVIIGDLHGGYPELLYKIRRFEFQNTSFIQVGDWGLGFQAQRLDIAALSQIDSFLEEKKNRLYILRGNHDNKWFWNHREELELRNITLVRDYEVLRIDEQNIFFIGGGISIDRSNRTEGRNYWSDEVVCFDARLLQLACRQHIDMVISHISPKETWPFTYPPIVEHFITKESALGKDLSTDLEEERQLMSAVYSALKPTGIKQWYYGHYHESYTEVKDGIVFRCLDIQELYNTETVIR